MVVVRVHRSMLFLRPVGGRGKADVVEGDERLFLLVILLLGSGFLDRAGVRKSRCGERAGARSEVGEVVVAVERVVPRGSERRRAFEGIEPKLRILKSENLNFIINKKIENILELWKLDSALWWAVEFCFF